MTNRILISIATVAAAIIALAAPTVADATEARPSLIQPMGLEGGGGTGP
jgi:hypothetical protein